MTTNDSNRGKRKATFVSLAVALCASHVTPAAADTTPAGTSISNTATLTFVNGGSPRTLASNTVSLVTAELLNVAITPDRSDIAVQSSAAQAVGFLVTNSGNGNEPFVLTVASDRPGVAVTRVAIDTNNDGVYDAATDQLLGTDGVLTLAPGQQLRVFVLVDGAQVTAATRITATVVAKAGSGAPGTVLAGLGDNGGDAIVGATRATATASSTLTPTIGQPVLTKSQSVFAPDGSTRAMHGAIVTYRLVASFPASTRGVAIDDPIPAGTDYVPGSLTLDDRTLSDASDGDAGTANTTSVRVALGDIAANATRTIQFSVKIQ